MENAADAIKIAFAVIVFSIALALTFMLVSQAKSTSDHVLYYSDETNFYDYKESSSNNRKVSSSEVISVLHRYYIETIAVTVKIGNNTFVFDSGNETILLKNVTALNTYELKERNLDEFIKTYLKENDKFIEEFVEAPISGKYSSQADDDSEIVITPGGRKLYITYTKDNT